MRVLVLSKHPRSLRALAVIGPAVALPLLWLLLDRPGDPAPVAAPLTVAAGAFAAGVNALVLSRFQSRIAVDDAAGVVHVRGAAPAPRRARTLQRARIRATGIRIEMNSDDDVVFVAVILLVTGESIDAGPSRMKSREAAIAQAARAGQFLGVPLRS